MKPLKVFVISHLRSHNVQKLQGILGIPCTWVVGKGETEEYKKAGAINVIEGGTLVESRNKALDVAFAEDCVCVEVSDDLGKIEKLDMTTKEKKPITFAEALEVFNKEIWYTPFKLYGIAPTANAFFIHKARSLNLFIIGDLIVVKPTKLRFDPDFNLKEDYDYTAQHIKEYGGVMRFNDLLFTFKHYSNKGGAVSYRNDEYEEKAVQKLMTKHPHFFRLNPKRKHEILMKVPKSPK